MKDEIKGKMSEFIVLNSEMYFLVDADGEGSKKAKGVNRSVLRDMRHKKFVDFLFNKGVMRHKMKRIPSKVHRIETYDACEISLSYLDSKRDILDDGINSVAYFHKDVKKQWKM